MTITSDAMLERATKLAGAACAATGTTNYSVTDLALNMGIYEMHDGSSVVHWSIYIGDIATDGEHASVEEALDALEEKINRMQAG